MVDADWWEEPRHVIGHRNERRYGAFTFLCLVVFLTLFGLTMLYSSSYDEAVRHNLPHYYFFLRQCAFVALAFLVSLVIFFMPLRYLERLTWPFLLGSLVLMLLTLFSPLGSTTLGARRWIRLGPMSLQSSEVVKIASIFFISSWHSKEHRKGICHLVPLGVMLGFAALILLQRDFSTTIVYLCLCLSLEMAAGLHIGILLLCFGCISVPGILAILTEPYRIQRMASFLFPGLDRSGASYQVESAMKAMRSGGLFGVGIGRGTYKLGLIPEVQNDFIFASMCEELGLFWMLFLLALFFLFAFLGYRSFALMVRHDRFLGFLDFGLTTMIVSQAAINVAVVIGLLPPTGIPLPFFSQGGTNLFVTLLSCALLLRIMVELGKMPGESTPDSERIVQFPVDRT